jgi:CRISPR/Cas system CSM-associated protein Csm3 (group 7 of RAMP superfamily)
MSRMKRSVLHLARFTLQAKSALSIGSGEADGVYDHPIVRDANGLPAIPGTSLAGVLRHLWIADRDSKSADALFGYQHRGMGEASRLEVAACALHDSHGQPVEGLLIEAAGQKRLREDELLKAALATREHPLFRDRVRIGHRGAAEKTGKFDRGILAAGHRFSGEMRLWSEHVEDPDWEALLALLADARLRLGGGTRAGLGAIACITLHRRSFDLRKAEDVAAFSALGTGLADTAGLAATPPHAGTGSRATTLHIKLAPRDFWRIGQGDEAVGRHEKEPDLLPKLEPVVEWREGRATIALRHALVPGPSVKGALAHRVAFHWNASNGTFADDMTPEQLRDWDKSRHCDGVRALFGFSKDREAGDDGSRQDTGQAGHVIVDDTYVQVSRNDVQAMIHNSIDRFTGGVRNRMLFSEELIWRRPIELSITLLPGVNAADPKARAALARALRDLCAGRLALGAGATKGHGSFIGEPDAETERWIKQHEELAA